jgi:methylmalonyl-CoA/ethylmalonyl-CoA epimerase
MYKDRLINYGGIDLKIDHIGYAVEDMCESVESFEKIGYEKFGDLVNDYKRGIMIQYMKNNGYKVELVAPINDKAPIITLLKNVGCTPYHICYEVKDIEKEVESLEKDNYVILSDILISKVINKKVCFMYKDEIGTIELIENSGGL